MPDNNQGSIHSASEGGVIGKHPDAGPSPLVVAPSTSSEFNTARLRLIPIACFSIGDIRFKFDSSFVLPAVQAEMTEFSALRDLDRRIKGAPISIFGHADPSFQGNFDPGNANTAGPGDDYNKNLSGRRAIAIYALLIREPSFWETLFSTHLGADVWGTDAIQIMLDAVSQQGDSSFGSSSQGSSASAQSARAQDIANDRSQRKQLFLQYMNFICGDLKLDKSVDFLARNAGTDQKGDVQGCSRFNPLVLFSSEDEDRFAQAWDDQDQPVLRGERDPRNAHNRRVLILVFRKGSQVLPAKWPCPTYKEGTAGCKKRFWSDDEARRSTHLPGIERKFKLTQDTFACRFYQRISNNSLCDSLTAVRVRLYDPYEQFIAFAPFEATIGTRAPFKGRADNDGIIILPDVEPPASCEIAWGFPPDQGQDPILLFRRTILLVGFGETGADAAVKKLSNLGYDDDDTSVSIIGFQLDYGHLTDPVLEPTGELDDRTLNLLNTVYQQAADDLRRPQLDESQPGA